MAVNLSMLAGAGAQFFDNSGVILSGGLIYTYAAGTTTPQAAYTTSSGSTAHTNPIVLDSAGRVASGGEIWLTDAVAYKFVLKTATATTIGTYDNVTGNASGIYAAFAASSGSSLVGFIQSGTGAVATTVQTKLRESVSVKDFGAVGDGTTNDTTAIQAALNSGAKTVNFVSTGNYLVTSSLTIPINVIIQGNNAKITSNTHFKVLNFTNGGGVFNLRMQGAGDSIYVTDSIAINCVGTNNYPLAPTYVVGPTIQNCTISLFGEYGINFQYVKQSKVTGNKIDQIAYAGIGCASCSDCVFDGNFIKDIITGSAGGDAYGIFISRASTYTETSEPRSQRCLVANNIVENITSSIGSNGHGIDTHGGTDIVITGNTVRNCEGGIFLTSSLVGTTPTYAPIRCIVSNNTLSTTVYLNYGIIIYGAISGVTVNEYATNCIVSNNSMLGYGSVQSATVPGMYMWGTKNSNVTGNVFSKCGASCIQLDYQNINVHISDNQLIDPHSTTYSGASCIGILGNYVSGYIGNNSYRFEDSGLDTYVAINSVRIEASLTNLDLNFARSTFQGIDATHLIFLANTTSGVLYSGLFQLFGSDSITVTSGGSNGFTDVTFAKRFPYIPNIQATLNYPFNQGGKFPIIGLDTVVAPVPTATGFRIYAQPYDGSTWTASGSLSFTWSAQ